MTCVADDDSHRRRTPLYAFPAASGACRLLSTLALACTTLESTPAPWGQRGLVVQWGARV
eukprot:179012-Pleurochrysis_carterae.AAC.3